MLVDRERAQQCIGLEQFYATDAERGLRGTASEKMLEMPRGQIVKRQLCGGEQAADLALRWVTENLHQRIPQRPRLRSYQRDISSIAIHDAAAQPISDHCAVFQPA